jgi:hypothetical protein
MGAPPDTRRRSSSVGAFGYLPGGGLTLEGLGLETGEDNEFFACPLQKSEFFDSTTAGGAMRTGTRRMGGAGVVLRQIAPATGALAKCAPIVWTRACAECLCLRRFSTFYPSDQSASISIHLSASARCDEQSIGLVCQLIQDAT